VDGELPEHCCQGVKAHFVDLFESLPYASAIDIRSKCIQEGAHWAGIRSNRFCLFCLMNIAQHPLPCGHSLCGNCVQIRGVRLSGTESGYAVAGCDFCKTQVVAEISLKPITAGFRLLSIDGGGTRGVIALEELRLLQEALGPFCRIQDFFDMVTGTSSGNG